MPWSWPTRPTAWVTATDPPDGLGPPGERTGALLREGTERLTAAGSETPRLDAELLLGHAIGVGRTTVVAHHEAPVGPDAARRYRADLERRAAGEPVAYLRGFKEFRGLAFQVDRRALIPRPETERLVELAEDDIRRRLGEPNRDASGRPIRIVDVGTGSGVIAVALAVSMRRFGALSEIDLLATDVSAEALGLARENAVGHAVADRIAFAEVDLLPQPIADARFDLILANLPYVRADAMAHLPPATAFEPALALDGGRDGLGVIARLLDLIPGALAMDGVVLLEIGADQRESIIRLAGDRLPGWACSVEADLAGLPRVARLTRITD
jgi:release factor glutamine methyltransferase